MGAERWDEQVGSVADEAGRLLESLRRSAAEAARVAAMTPDASSPATTAATTPDAPTPDATADARTAPTDTPTAGDADDADARPASGPDVEDLHDEHDHDPLTGGAAPHDPVCQWCPICRGVAVVRSLSPETLTRLADLASVAASVLADLASVRASTDPTTSDAPTTPRRPEPAASRPIPVRDAGDPQEAPRG